MDAIDRHLVDLLRTNARLSYAELARQVGLSAPAVHERVAKLEATGVLRGYQSEMTEIESCYFMAGEESFLLKARVGTIAELEHLIVRLNRTPGIARTRTAIAMSTKWEGRPPPQR